MPVMLPAETKPFDWKTVALADGTAFEIMVEAPDYLTFLEGMLQTSRVDLARTRFSCIKGWRGVFRPMPNGGQSEVPFSEENLTLLMRSSPRLHVALLEIINPYFQPITEDEGKNSVAPSTKAAATSPNPSESTPDTSVSNP